MVRTGIRPEDWVDEGPSRARVAPRVGTLNGNLVVGRSGAKSATEDQKAAMRDRWANRDVAR